MNIRVDDYEKLGAFYLGRTYDLGKKSLEDELVLYDSKDLVTHGVVLGMTGSGKTGLCLSILEEAAMDGIPAIVIDPKGDIANLMLTFPDMKGEDFRPWVNEEDARKKGMTPDAYAQGQAEMWKEGLADWGQDGSRVLTFRDKVDVSIYTPGSNAGIPVSILSSLQAPPFEVADDSELLGERIESTVSSLLSLLGIDADPIRSQEHILVSSIFGHYWRKGENLTLATLIKSIQSPPFTQVGVMDLESFYPEDRRYDLSMQINNLLAAPGFATWLEGEALDIRRMLYTPEGKPRVGVFSIAHLSDSERMFFVSLLLNQMLGWMREQSGTSSLRALLYMDEIYGYLPPSQNPPSKKPMLTMLKQARAFGLGVLLATQNPVDLDYKALSNMGTWFLGRLQTERDKARVLDGLEGAAATQGGEFDRQKMEQTLAGLGSRVFLLNNVHEDGPVTFHVRWVMSYLRGPLTRKQIKMLMDPVKAAAPKPETEPDDGGGEKGSSGKGKPSLPKGVEEFYVETTSPGATLVYVPAIIRAAEAHINDKKKGVRGVKKTVFVNRLTPDMEDLDWEEREELPKGIGCVVRDSESDAATYRSLPPLAIKAGNYKKFGKEMTEWFYRDGGFKIFYSPTFDIYSQPGETEVDFRLRLQQSAREERDRQVGAMREKFAKQIDKMEDKVERAQDKLAKEKEQAKSAKMDTIMSMGTTLLGALFGRKKLSIGNLSRGRSTVSRASRAWRESGDVGRAEENMKDMSEDLENLEKECEKEIGKLKESLDPDGEKLEIVTVPPYKKDIVLKAIGLAWLPYKRVDEFSLERAW